MASAVTRLELSRNAEMLIYLKESIALQVALQSGVLKECERHHQIFYDDQDPKPAFELMLELFENDAPEVAGFSGNCHELTDILSEVIAHASAYCLHCRYGKIVHWESADLASAAVRAAGSTGFTR